MSQYFSCQHFSTALCPKDKVQNIYEQSITPGSRKRGDLRPPTESPTSSSSLLCVVLQYLLRVFIYSATTSQRSGFVSCAAVVHFRTLLCCSQNQGDIGPPTPIAQGQPHSCEPKAKANKAGYNLCSSCPKYSEESGGATLLPSAS